MIPAILKKHVDYVQSIDNENLRGAQLFDATIPPIRILPENE